ncbi:MAG: glycosyl hydrolase family 88 [Ruminiclostridium sp.]|nr:glycosyl hydrolase family 88 [Ruminiclostridium sp.]
MKKFKNNYGIRMSDSVMKRDPLLPVRWSYDYGVVFKGMEMIWNKTGDDRYYRYIRDNMDIYVDSKGYIGHYQPHEYNIDHVNNGKVILMLYKKTHQERYALAASLLREQLRRHPRIKEGGFWHKFIYPHQMWLDGLYMGCPFYCEYAKVFNEPDIFDDVARQILLMNEKARDLNTGLLYHGYDESRGMKWADDKTGCSPNFWGRAMGWYAMAIVDVLENFPQQHPERGEIITAFRNMADALAKVQDEETGLWWQVLDQGSREGNYLEASCSSMFVYAIAKAIRMKVLDDGYSYICEKGYQGLVSRLVQEDKEGLLNLLDTCQVAGLGNNPYRDGSFEYYISEPRIVNDLKGIGAFIQACAEMEE